MKGHWEGKGRMFKKKRQTKEENGERTSRTRSRDPIKDRGGIKGFPFDSRREKDITSPGEKGRATAGEGQAPFRTKDLGGQNQPFTSTQRKTRSI